MSIIGSGGRFIQRAFGLIVLGVVAAGSFMPVAVSGNSGGVRTRVVRWGDPYRPSPPQDLTNAVQISCGDIMGMAATADRRLVIWGDNYYGQMDVPPDLTNIVAVAAGHAHCLALRDDGTVVAWGSGKTSPGYFAWPENGQAIVPPGLSGVKAIVASYRNSLALRSNGTVVCWGNNENYFQNNVPSSVNGSTAIACYQDFCLALKTNGTVVRWGATYSGLGSVPAGLTGVMDIAAGSFRGFALRSNGTAVAWGTSYVGEGVIPAGFSGIKSIVAGTYHNLALRTNSTVFAWGANSEGQTNVPPGLTNVIQISARGFQSLALIDDSIPSPPVIASQPESCTNNAGTAANFTVVASVSGTPPFTYQWKRDGTNLADGPSISGTTTPTLSLGNAQAPDGASYSAVISNEGGSVTSAVVSLTVLSGAPFILTQPTDTTVLAGTASASLSVAVGGSEPITYQWHKNGTPLGGTTLATLNFYGVQETDSGNYFVVANNSFGSVTSSVVAFVAVSCQPKPVGLVAWWRGEDNGQDHALSNHLTGAGITYAPGQVGQSLNFDGLTSYQIAPASASLTVKDFTVEGWIYATNVSQSRPIIEWAGLSGLASVQIWLNKGPTGTLHGQIYVGLRTTPDTGLREEFGALVVTNEWTHFAVTVRTSPDGTSIFTFRNGYALGGRTYLVPFTPNTSLPVNVGSRPSSSGEGLGGRRFLGKIDELSVYNRVLSDAEVWAIYQAGNGGKCPAGNQPFITTQPTNQIVNGGMSVTFVAAAAGALPLNYQWRRDGVDLPGANSSVLSLPNAQFSQAGVYSVLASNAFGTVLSSNATLTVLVPAITNVAPLAGIIGDVITIRGRNFSPIAASNVVFFGAVRASVITATPTMLTVTMPAGATYDHITVTADGLTAFSPKPFQPTFIGDNSGITASDFGTPFNLTGGDGGHLTDIKDLTDDGFPDLAVANAYGHNLSLFLRVADSGLLRPASFAARIDLASISGPGDHNPYGIVAADLNGDAKPDLIIADRLNNRLLAYQNITLPSFPSTVSFAPPVAIPTGADPRYLRAHDLDADGRVDLVVCNYASSTISLLKNVGTAGDLTSSTFAPRVDIAAGPGAYDVVCADIDGDGKTDLASTAAAGTTISLFRNVTAPGILDATSFAPRVDLTAHPDTGATIVAGDLDGDGKAELISGGNSRIISVYRNLAVPGALTIGSFATPVDLACPGWVHNVALADMDGDTRADVVAVGELNSYAAVFRNESSPGSLTPSSFGARVDLATGWNAWGLAVGDLDLDGRPEIVFENAYEDTVTIYPNLTRFGGPPVLLSGPGSATVTEGNAVEFRVVAQGSAPMSYQWYFNGTNLPGATTDSIQIREVSFADEGGYYVTISNHLGFIVSAGAALDVVPATCVTPPANLAGWWRGDFNTADFASELTATLFGNAAFGPGKVGSAFRFDGDHDGVLLANSARFQSAAFTIEMWMQRGSAVSVSGDQVFGGGATFFGSGPGGLSFGLETDGRLFLGQLDAGRVATTVAISDTNWHHVAATFSGGLAVLYLDGLQVTSTGFAGSFSNSVAPAIGTRGDGAGGTFLGALDEVSYHTRALSWVEVYGIYRASFAGKCTDGLPPTLLAHPANITVPFGGNGQFMVEALGTPTLAYQWFVNGSPLAGATSATLTLSNVTFADAGASYLVVVTNDFGAVTSSVAIITVPNTAPQIIAPANLSVDIAAPVPLLNFFVNDLESNPDGLTVEVSSSNTNVVNVAGLLLGGTGTNRTLTVTPLPDRAGLTRIRLAVLDPGGMSNVTTFSLTINQFTNLSLGVSGAIAGAMAWGDYDNDGDLDLIQSGTTNNFAIGGILRLFRNDAGVLTLATNFPGLYRSSVAWADYNRDGFLDLLICGQTTAGVPVTRIYRNSGNGSLTDINAPLLGVSSGTATWADYDNDGDVDAFVTGLNSTNLTGLFTNQARLYRNDGGDVFAEVAHDLPAVSGGGAAWADYDKDGWTDVVLVGTRFTGGTSGSPTAALYRNLRNGSFGLIPTGLSPVASGSVAWADGDNDGDLDLLLAHNNGAIYYRYNGGNSFTAINLFIASLTGPSCAWADYDNDGDMDAMAGGATTVPCQNFGNGTFLPSANLINSYNGALAWGDVDNDGDLDLAMMGSTNGGTSGATTVLVKNLITVSNPPPAAPQFGTTITGSTNSVTMVWLPPADSVTPSNGLNYNLRLGTTPGGSDIISPFADPVTGLRRVAAMGNADSTNRWTILNLPAGTYHWSVQAIDGTFAGSEWASSAKAGDGQFQIINQRPVISPVANQFTGPSAPLLVPFTISDAETGAGGLLVSARSSNTNVLANTALVLGGVGTNRTVTITPRQGGQSTVTLTVRDANGAFAERAFIVSSEQFTPLSTPFTGVAASMVSWADFDNDGDLDVLTAGLTNLAVINSTTTRLYRNEGAGGFLQVAANFPGVCYGSAGWGDYDNDGDLDLLFTGATTAPGGPIFSTISRLYRNDGVAGFTNTSLVLPGVRNSAVAWADYDNDGDLDFLLAGQTNSSTPIARLYRNQGGGAFALATNFTGLFNGAVAWGDCDSDGDLDLLMTGQSVTGGASTLLYRNNGNGVFAPVATSMQGVYTGSIAWGDCDSDGDLDVLLTGYNGSFVTRVYLNNGNGNSFSDFSNGLPGTRYGSAAWGDFDNDGRLDILLSGTTNSLYAGATTRVFRNTGQFFSIGIPSFTNWPAQLPPNYLGQAAWADFDNDGDLDISFVGADSVLVGDAQGRAQSALIRNNNGRLNTPPSTPTNLVVTFTTTNVTLNWARATDAQTTNQNGLKYQVRVGTTTGGIEKLSPHADLANGYRRIVSSGTAATNRWRLTLPPGNYFWSVQAIDTAFAGSPFSVEGAFTVTNRAPLATNQIITMNEDTNRVIVLAGSDPDAQPLTFSIVDPPTNGVLSGVAPNVIYRPNTNYFGLDNFRYKATDGELESAPATVSITIAAVNDRPTFTRGPDFTVDEDAGLQIIPSWATDISPGAPNETNQLLTFLISTPNFSLFSIQPTISPAGTLQFQFAPNVNGTATVTVRLKDNVGTSPDNLNTSPAITLLLTALSLNDAPVAFSQSLTSPEDSGLPVVLSASDVDGDGLSFIIVTNPAHGTLSGELPTLIYTPDTNYFGPDSFAFIATDGQTNSQPAIVHLNLTSVNDAPIPRISIAPLATFPGLTNLIVIAINGTNTPVTLDGSGSTDVENDPLSFEWRDDTNVLASITTTNVELTVGTHELSLQVSDSTESATATATLEVLSPQTSVGIIILILQESGLGRTEVRPLTASLKAVAASFENDQLLAALRQLVAFQNKVRAQVEPTNPELAAQLIAAAQTLIDLLAATE